MREGLREEGALGRIGLLGRHAIGTVGTASGCAALLYASVKGAVLERRRGRRLLFRTVLSQVYYTAIEPILFVALLAFLSGMGLLLTVDQVVPLASIRDAVGALLAVVLLREAFPLLLAIVLVARSGTAISTELGYMRIRGEIDVLEAEGVNVEYHLVLPRVVGVALSAAALLLVMSLAALLGAMLASRLFGLVEVPIDAIPVRTGAALLALGKTAAFGAIIALVHCREGLAVGHSHREIPKANAEGVTRAAVLCLLLNAALTLATYVW